MQNEHDMRRPKELPQAYTYLDCNIAPKLQQQQEELQKQICEYTIR